MVNIWKIRKKGSSVWVFVKSIVRPDLTDCEVKFVPEKRKVLR